jgi:hypothetical protein
VLFRSRVIEKIARYDEEAAEDLKRERIRRFNIDRAARQLVVKYVGRGHGPEELEEFILFGIRCRLAIATGWPSPPDISPNYYRRPPNTIKRQNPDEAEKSSPNKSTEEEG